MKGLTLFLKHSNWKCLKKGMIVLGLISAMTESHVIIVDYDSPQISFSICHLEKLKGNATLAGVINPHL
jgi:hypothetical protein